jgi:hypothetical protein
MSLTCRRAVIATLAVLGALCTAPAAAPAAPGASAALATAASVTVGQAGVAGSITLTNANTGAEAGTTNVVCNAGAGSPCLGANERGIELVPSCAIEDELACATGNADPGVFQVSPVATGRLGSACAGMAFAVSVSDPATGAARFTPQPAGTAVTLPGAGTACVIEFTQAVLRSPATDARALDPGIQTLQVVGHTQAAGPSGASGAGSTIVNVLPATASLASTASGTVAVGGSVTDAATVTGLIDPVAGGTFTFRLFGPASASTCSGTPLFTSTNPAQLSGTTATATSSAFTTNASGTHRWVATYDGDAHNLPIDGACGAPGESVEVTAGGGGGGGGGVTGTPPLPAKLEVARAFVDRAARRLSVLAPISARASGRVSVRLQAAGRTATFTEAVDSANARVRFSRRISAAQARLGTGILTLTYPGDPDTQPQEVRLRAAPRRAQLVAGRPAINAGRLTATGRISTRARGAVRVQLLFEPAGENTRTVELTAPVAGGRYSLSRALPPAVLAQLEGRRGVVHSYTLFTGYAPASMRGEMASFQVLAAP